MLDGECRRHKTRRSTAPKALLVPLVCLLAIALPVLAQTSSNYDLSWHVVAGGGGRMESSGHTLMGTTGQAGAGLMASGTYTLVGGFWAGGAPASAPHAMYLPLVLGR